LSHSAANIPLSPTFSLVSSSSSSSVTSCEQPSASQQQPPPQNASTSQSSTNDERRVAHGRRTRRTAKNITASYNKLIERDENARDRRAGKEEVWKEEKTEGG
jgi:hypothetical protein